MIIPHPTATILAPAIGRARFLALTGAMADSARWRQSVFTLIALGVGAAMRRLILFAVPLLLPLIQCDKSAPKSPIPGGILNAAPH